MEPLSVKELTEVMKCNLGEVELPKIESIDGLLGWCGIANACGSTSKDPDRTN